MGKKKIPKLKKDELINRAFKIKPLQEEKGNLFFLAPTQIKNFSFNFFEKTAQIAENLTEVAVIETYHKTHGVLQVFQPEIEEVLKQIPEKFLDKVVAFKTNAIDSNAVKATTSNQKYHIGKTTLYSGTLPESIKNQPVVLKKKKYIPSNLN